MRYKSLIQCRLWKTDLHRLSLRFPHPLHIVGHVSIRAVFNRVFHTRRFSATSLPVHEGEFQRLLTVEDDAHLQQLAARLVDPRHRQAACIVELEPLWHPDP